MPRLKLLSVFGTRPEAIKMAPVLHELSCHTEAFDSVICVTAQQRELLDQVLQLFQLAPQFDLNIMKPDQSLFDITSHVLLKLKPVIEQTNPDIVLVHGDTTSSFAAALAAYYCRVKVAHIEAGLRSYNKFAPFPEEVNRRLTASLADIHFAPTEITRQNLLREGVDPSSVYVTGNTVVDALLFASRQIENNLEIKLTLDTKFSFLEAKKKMILVTGHRRENFGDSIRSICEALTDLANYSPDIQIVYPVHLNPNICIPVRNILSQNRNIYLIDPVDYTSFVYLMKRSELIITDSGGIQEEAPSLGKPVLVTRMVTERPEAVNSGNVKLVGSDRARIVKEAIEILYAARPDCNLLPFSNPYGDGYASIKIVSYLQNVCRV